MNRIILLVAAVTVAAGCAPTDLTPDEGGSKAKAAAPVLGLGVDLENFDPAVRAQDDFYNHVNGKWLARTEIPEDKSNYGAFTELFDQSEIDLRKIIDEAAASDAPAGSDMQRVGSFYRSFMDTDSIEAAGLTPLADDMARIDGIRSVDELAGYFGYAQTVGIGNPVVFWVNQDAKNTTEYIGYFHQGGLGLPDRDYYFKDEEKFIAYRDQYRTHIANMLVAAGMAGAEDAARRIFALEKRLATSHWERVKNRDRNATYNNYDISAAGELTPGFDWPAFLDGAGIGQVENLVIRQPDYFSALGRAVQETPLDDWKIYLKWQALSTSAPFLPKRFVDENFDFYSRTLSGIEQNRPRWKRAVQAVNNSLGEVLGRIYVERHFQPASKERMDELVENLRLAFRGSIDTLEWMGDETKVQAQAKLAKFTPKIGYPKKWKDYSKLSVGDDTLLQNVLNSQRVEYQRMIDKLGNPIDRDEWFMTPQTVNAYYNPSMNEIVFPAAILQPPFFNVAADDAVNYGGIGAVIGHEFSHGFDDQGRKSDGDGTLRDWWTEQDADEFKRRAQGLIEQYDAFSPLEGANVNGEFTLGENIGDLAGLTMAYRAYKLSLKGREAPVIGGYTGDQRFFLGWAQVWRRLYRDEELQRRLVTDPHSPSQYRVNGIVANMPEFQKAFDVSEGDRLYRSPSNLVKIW